MIRISDRMGQAAVLPVMSKYCLSELKLLGPSVLCSSECLRLTCWYLPSHWSQTRTSSASRSSPSYPVCHCWRSTYDVTAGNCFFYLELSLKPQAPRVFFILPWMLERIVEIRHFKNVFVFFSSFRSHWFEIDLKMFCDLAETAIMLNLRSKHVELFY